MLDFRLFGAAELLTPDGRSLLPVLAQPKRVAILVYLALAVPRGFHRRDTLLALFWPESDERHARHALNQALYHLRQSVGEGAIRSRNDEEVGLEWEAWTCDVVSFRAALAAGRLEEAVELYRGELLAGFHADAAPEFDQWLEDQRRESRRGAFAAALELGSRAADAGRRSDAEPWLRRAAAIAPYEESAVRALMELLARAGDKPGALAAYETFAARLASELGAPPSDALRAFARSVRAVAPADDQSPAQPIAATPQRPVRRRRPGVAAGVAVGLVAVLTVGYLASGPHGGDAPPGTDIAAGTGLVIADMTNRTSDPQLGVVVTELLRTDLHQSSAIRVAGAGEVRQLLELMKREPGAPLDPATAREVAVRGNFPVVLEGMVGRAGTGYVITAVLLASESGETLATFRANARREDELVDAMDALSSQVRRQLGESLRRIRATPPLHRVSTPSLEALRKYAAAWRVINPCEPRCREQFVALLEEAIAIDTAFGAAYRALGAHLYSTGERERALHYLAKAYQFRERMTDLERYHSIGTYHRLVTGDRVKAINAFEAELELAHGNDDIGFGALEHLGLLYYGDRDYGRAEEMWRRRAAVKCGPLRCGPQPAYVYTKWAETLTAQGRLAEALAVVQRGDSLWPDANMLELVAEVAYALHGHRAVDSALRSRDPRGRFRGRPVDSVLAGSLFPARRATIEGRLRDAERAYGRTGLGPRVLAQMLSETDLFVRGDPTASWQRLQRAIPPHVFDSLPALQRPYPSFILSLSRGGRTREARALLGEFERAVPDSIRHMALYGRWLDYSRGELALAEGRAAAAVMHFRNGLVTVGCAGCVLPALGRAFEAAGQPDSAVALYEQYLGPANDLDRSYFDGAYLGFLYERLAELHELRGDALAAGRYYARLVDLWEHADPELQPRVRQARARLAALLAKTS